jgi:hypothetical protein
MRSAVVLFWKKGNEEKEKRMHHIWIIDSSIWRIISETE